MRAVLSILLLASMVTIIVSNPQGFLRPGVRPAPYQQVPVVEEEGRPELPEETKEVILEYVAEKMEDAYPNLIQDVQTRTNLFNLSAYLNSPGRPTNGTALTFVPLITLLSGLFAG